MANQVSNPYKITDKIIFPYNLNHTFFDSRREVKGLWIIFTELLSLVISNSLSYFIRWGRLCWSLCGFPQLLLEYVMKVKLSLYGRSR
jgi:hypothetical protein